MQWDSSLLIGLLAHDRAPIAKGRPQGKSCDLLWDWLGTRCYILPEKGKYTRVWLLDVCRDGALQPYPLVVNGRIIIWRSKGSPNITSVGYSEDSPRSLKAYGCDQVIIFNQGECPNLSGTFEFDLYLLSPSMHCGTFRKYTIMIWDFGLPRLVRYLNPMSNQMEEKPVGSSCRLICTSRRAPRGACGVATHHVAWGAVSWPPIWKLN